MAVAALKPTRISYARRRMDAAPAASQGRPHNTIEALNAFRRPLSVKELADILGCSADQCYDLCNAGHIPAIQIPGMKLKKFDPSVIADWIGRHNPQIRKLARPA